MGVLSLAVNLSLLLQSSSGHQNVAEPKPDELSALLGESQGFWNNLWICSGVSPGCQIHFSHQCYWKLVPGPGHCHNELQNLQICARCCNKSNEGHPFKQFLEVDVTLPADKVSSLSDCFFSKLNAILLKLKSILLVENTVESVKFAVLMYLLTYIGAMMNGLTIVTLAWVGAFSLPRVYRDNQKQIDEAILPLKTKFDDLQGKLQAALPASIVGKKDE